MKRSLSRTFGLISLGMIGLASGPAGAATTANGPYYATPSWDQTLPASTRFIVLSNFASEAVLDRETGRHRNRTWNSYLGRCPKALHRARCGDSQRVAASDDSGLIEHCRYKSVSSGSPERAPLFQHPVGGLLVSYKRCLCSERRVVSGPRQRRLLRGH
jgi:hypothetical protein